MIEICEASIFEPMKATDSAFWLKKQSGALNETTKTSKEDEARNIPYQPQARISREAFCYVGTNLSRMGLLRH